LEVVTSRVEDMPVSTMESDIDGSHGDHQGHTYPWIFKN